MIEQLTGTLLKNSPTHLVVDVQGVGYGLHVSLRTSAELPKQGELVSIETYLHVKEGIMELYGFANTLEKDVFLRLISVSGIGPRIALRMLSEVSPGDMVQYVLQGDVKSLTALKGIGKKTAEMMVIALRSQFEQLSDKMEASSRKAISGVEEEVLLALISLGAKEKSAKEAILKVQNTHSNASELSTSEYITAALSVL
jgi:Holliday junction DNA helicase RuvA